MSNRHRHSLGAFASFLAPRKAIILGTTALGLLAASLLPNPAMACGAITTLTNGTNANASTVMDNFNTIRNCVNTLESDGTINNATLTGTTILPGSGRISSTGLLGLGMTPTNILDITQSQNSISQIRMINNNAGNAARSTLRLEVNSQETILSHQGTGYTPVGLFKADGTLLQGAGAGGLTIGTGANQPIYFGTNTAERARINGAGELTVGYGATDNGAYLLQVNSQIFATNATIATSDLRLKSVIGGPNESLLKAAFSVPTILYTRIDRPQDKMRAGYGAQDWEKALADNDLSDNGIVVALNDGTLALDESAAQVLKIAALEHEVTLLKDRLAKLESTP